MARAGTPAYERPFGDRYTTADQLRLEDQLLRAGGWQVPSLMSAERAHELLRQTGWAGRLNEGQRSAVAGMASSPRFMSLTSGPAGTGKTTMLNAFREIIEANGGRVVAVAPSSVAAQQLKSQGGFTEAHNTAQWLGKIEGTCRTRPHMPIGRGDVLVLDEANMASNRDLAGITGVRGIHLTGLE